jgi:hypothetical protein
VGSAWADYDGDGDLDGLVAGWGSPQLLYGNTCDSAGGWLHLDLVGVTSNRSAIGARVRVVAGGKSLEREVEGSSGHFSQPSLTVEFGLGALAEADTVEIAWPSGTVQTLIGVDANQRLTVRELAGEVTGIGDSDGPLRPVLAAFPNPFRTASEIRYTLPTAERVSLTVYDVRGRRVRTVIDENVPAGDHTARWDGADENGRRVAAGVYLYRIEAGDWQETKRVVVLR